MPQNPTDRKRRAEIQASFVPRAKVINRDAAAIEIQEALRKSKDVAPRSRWFSRTYKDVELPPTPGRRDPRLLGPRGNVVGRIKEGYRKVRELSRPGSKR